MTRRPRLIPGWRGAPAVVLASCLMWLSACGGGPTTPGSQELSIRSITVSPGGAGIENATRFTFTADVVGQNLTGVVYEWHFGDGTTASGPAAEHVYARAGNHSVRLTVARAASRTEATTTARVASLVGRWTGSVTGHVPRFAATGVITSFILQVNAAPVLAGPADTNRLNITWIDNLGCRETRPSAAAVFGSVAHPRTFNFGLEQLLCADGDFYFNGTADENVQVISGTCPQGGANCRFQMVRQ